MEKITAGFIGGGFIGSAHAKVFSYYTNVKIYDILTEKATHSFQDTLDQDVIFVALNTPMKKNGSVDVSIIWNTLEKIRSNLVYWKPVIIKSTLPPFEMQKMIVEFQESMYLIFSPEFLTEKTAEFDLQQSNRFIFGVPNEEVNIESNPRQIVDELFHLRFPAVPRYWVSYNTASLVKYFTNVYFANKVSLMNEFSGIADYYGVPWEEIISLVLLDPRIGRSHFQVPGHDGRLGYGGHCFLKDIPGYVKDIAGPAQKPAYVTKAGWKTNIEVREAKQIATEFNKMIGRAIKEPITWQEIQKLIE